MVVGYCLGGVNVTHVFAYILDEEVFEASESLAMELDKNCNHLGFQGRDFLYRTHVYYFKGSNDRSNRLFT